MGVAESLRKNWFLFGIVIAILSAKTAPWIGKKGGPLYPEITVKYIAVSVIFFGSGISLRTEDLKAALMHFRLHLFVQSFTFLFVPVLINGLVNILSHTGINEWLLRGLLVVGCMPPPVSSAVIITKAIGGNDAGAIFNSAFGSFLGIFVTPLLLFLIVGVSSDVPVMKIVTTLCSTVVFPLLLGQTLRRCLTDWLNRNKPPFGTIGSFMLLLIIYTTFCDTFSSKMGGMSVNHVIIMGVLIFVIQVSLINLIFIVTTKCNMGYTPSDVVALMFCSTHKSLTLGMPMLKIIYAGYEYLPLISIPLLIYHPTQILLGGFLVPVIKNWLASFKPKVHENGGSDV